MLRDAVSEGGRDGRALDQQALAEVEQAAAEELDEAVQVTEWICSQLHTWGAWSWEERLCHETVAVVPQHSRYAAAFTAQLGKIAQQRGDYGHALDWYRQALTIFEELGDRTGIASSYHESGMIAQRQGDYDQALDWYRQALTIYEDLGDRAGIGAINHQLGTIADLRGDYDQALDWYHQALAIFQDLGDRAAMATAYHSLGTIADLRG